MKRRKLAIDLFMLQVAFEDNSGTSYFLNLNSGETIFYSDAVTDQEEIEELIEKVEDDDNYVRIPNIPVYEQHEFMVSFIESITDEDLKERLYITVDGRGAFHRFKNVLLHYPKQEKLWFQYRDKKINSEITEWFDTLDAELIDTNSE